MKRRQGIATLVTGTLIVLALLAVFALELSSNQSRSRRSLEAQAHQRAVLVSGLMDAVFQAVGQLPPAMQAAYGTPTVSDRLMQRVKANNDYVALVGPGGRIVAHSTGFTAQARAAVTRSSAVRAVLAGQPWSLGDVHGPGHAQAIDLVAGVHTPTGIRARASGLPLAALSAFALGELRKVPGVRDQHLSVVDSRGVIIASTNPLRPAGYVFHTPNQLRALSHGSGVLNGPTGPRYYDQVALPDTTWKLILSAPAGEFFASVSGLRHDVPWIIFAAFGLVALAALLLVRRSILANERIRRANLQLTDANAELNGAHARLEQANGALGQSNDQLERQARELARSNTELDQFASIASHDLQEPLRKVRTFTERISETERDNLSERGLDYLRRANASAERMQTLIEDLLRFSRVSTQGQPFSAVDLSRITEDVLDDLSEQVSRADARIEVGALPTLNADAAQMRQLMQNLISNALKFHREGVAPVVRIESTVDSGWATIVVADNGIGFDPQYSRRIFRVFERLHGRGAYPGTGIGLALCRKIAERHGGTVVADSVPDEGATFTVTLQTQRGAPVADEPAEELSSDHPAPAEEPYVTV